MARIGIDLDGVIYNFEESVRHYLVNWEGYSRDELPDPTGWHIDKQWGMTRKQFQMYCHLGVDIGVIFLHGGAIRAAREGVSALREQGHTIHICTARDYGQSGASASNTARWLAHESIYYDSLTFSHDKTIVAVDYMIDDRIENYDALVGAGVRAVLMDQPWNQDEEDQRGRVRASDMLDFANMVASYEMIGKPLVEKIVELEHINRTLTPKAS